MDDDFTTVPPKRRKMPLLIILVVVIVIVGLVIAWLLWFQPQKQSSTPITKLNTPSVQPELVTTGLKSPTSIVATSDKADSRLFILEQDGLIRIVDSSKKLINKPFLNISNKVLPGGEMGLLGMAFHPSYKQNGYFYVNYVDKNQNTVIARYKVSSDANVADPASEKVLFTLKQPYTNHNGGDLVFGPDGYLYIALGDGGSGGDPENRAQNKAEYFGKILRIDVDKGDPYSIPPTNPFVNEAGAKSEIWAYGLRNPWRISFDRTTGDLYIADVGQGELEEVNIQKATSKGGENYGWRCYEGKQTYKLDGCGDIGKYVMPVLEYDHNEDRCSITGGYVYRGTKYPALDGKYFYGDYCNGQLFYADNKNGTWTNVLAAETSYSISTFGQGNDGELYFADFKTGGIYHLRDAAN
jgi:glucose/arabinose dehydrogenase